MGEGRNQRKFNFEGTQTNISSRGKYSWESVLIFRLGGMFKVIFTLENSKITGIKHTHTIVLLSSRGVKIDLHFI